MNSVVSIQSTPMPFTGPLFRFALFRTRPDEYYLFTCCHHIVIDGTGVALVGHRIAAIYSAVVSGAPIPPAFFGSLQDLVSSELEYEASPDYLEDQAYWIGNLPSESGPDHRLRQDAGQRDQSRPSAAVQLDNVVLARVDELSQAWNMPRSSVVTAACALLVRDWCAEGSEVVLGFPVTRRVRLESKTLPGMVSGIVPLVFGVSPESTVADFCEHVDTRIREALQHQRFPVQALERKANPGSSGQPVNRVHVNFTPSIFTLEFGGVATSASYTASGLVSGLGLFFSGVGDDLYLSTAGSVQPLSKFDVSDLAERLHRVLVAMTADPAARVSSVEVLDAGERARLDGFGTRASLSGSASVPVSIPVLFAEHVVRSPDAVAISQEQRSWTYRELDEASNRLAHLLIGHGVGPGRCVALLLPRSAQAVVAILAVLKTGAAYLPIDPTVPAARMQFVLTDAAPSAVLTTAGLRSLLDGHEPVVIDVDDPTVATHPDTAVPFPAADDVAYLIYTSGTTGVPKGVAITHHNVTQLLGTLDAGLPHPGVWPLCHTLAFDVSVWEIFGALLRGGRLVVVPEEVVSSRRTSTPCWSANTSTSSPKPPPRSRCWPPRGWRTRRWWSSVKPAPPRWWTGGPPGG